MKIYESGSYPVFNRVMDAVTWIGGIGLAFFALYILRLLWICRKGIKNWIKSILYR